MTSTHQAHLPIPALPPAARLCHVFPQLTSGSLLSIGQLCDHGCQALFTATHLIITKDNTTILQGNRSNSFGQWLVHLPPSPILEPGPVPNSDPATHQTWSAANSLRILSQPIADRVAFYHATLFSPVLSTWCRAIDAGYFATWPELTSAQVRRHFRATAPMYQGHMDQERANQRSTKVSPASAAPPDLDTNPEALFVDVHLATGKVFLAIRQFLPDDLL
jgi:hypothetical protein